MAWLPRICLPGIPQHIIQRGNNRQPCFASDEDFSAYAHWLDEYARKYEVPIHAWVLMTNHVHLLVTPGTKDGTSSLMQTLGRHYVRYFKYSYKRSVTLWEGRFKTFVVDEENYLLICLRYIELNPVRANMVESPGQYRWFSYRANGLGKPKQLWIPHRIYRDLGHSPQERAEVYRSLFRGHLDEKLIHDIRQATQQGMVLGNRRFRQEIERLYRRRVTTLKRGPKRKVKEKGEEEFLL